MILAYSDPVALGFAASLAQPGGNITGVLMAAEPTMAAKRLELIKEAVPRAARIAALTTPEPPSRTQVQFMERAAPALGVKLIVIEVRDANYPATLPIERSTTFELAINLKTAKALGLTLPVSLRTRADHVIE